ncbi:MAG TPA: alpha/beta hydrolase, partial [Pseudomonadales bacterium]|nr:alpha/beta hydrolase [Pseudomonadales bacterium]
MLITGNAGNIEIAVDSAASARVGAIVCHPHPLYGGTMDDAVVAAICAGFARAGFASLRFNFRGV